MLKYNLRITIPNPLEVAVRVPDTLALGDSRIILSRKQNEKVVVPRR